MLTGLRPFQTSLTLATIVTAASAISLAAQFPTPRGGDSYPVRCGAGTFASDQRGYAPLPRGDVFCPLIADPKTMRSFTAYQRGDEKDLGTDIVAVGIADQFPFFRALASRAGNGLQLGLAGAVFAQFDLGTASYDLLNADYLIALPLSFRAGPFSGRARVYHQSSHLGDEFLLRPNAPKRQNLSFESAEILLSVDVSALRVYGGGENFFHRDPVELPDRLAHFGAELRPRANVSLGSILTGRIVGGVDVKIVNDTASRTGVSARAGFEFARPGDSEVPSRRWALLAEYYDGPSPYGQFHQRNVRLTGLGFHFTL